MKDYDDGVWGRDIKRLSVVAFITLIIVLIVIVLAGCATQRRLQAPSPEVPAPSSKAIVKPVLQSAANAAVNALLVGKTNMHFATVADLATNRTLWTWPVDLSCVGDTGGGMGTLIAPNMVIGNQHTLAGRLVFTGRSGKQYVANVGSFIRMDPTDFAIGVLESNMPPDVTLAMVFPPSVTNYCLDGMRGFWCQNSTHDIHLGEFNVYPGTGALWLSPMPTNAFGNFIGAGDSTSPAFTVLGGKPVFMFQTTGAEPSGWPPFHWLVWPNIPTNGLRVVNLSGYAKAKVPPKTNVIVTVYATWSSTPTGSFTRLVGTPVFTVTNPVGSQFFSLEITRTNF